MRSILHAIIVMLALINSTVPGMAHATLVRAEPAAGSKVAISPKELRLTFSETIDSASAKVTGRGGRAIATGPARMDDAVLILPLSAPLAPGVYRVEWQVTTTDTHKRSGRLSFEVAR